MKNIILPILILLLFICTGCTNNNVGSNTKTLLSKEKPLNSQVIKDKEFLISRKTVLGLKYADVIKIWGKPKEIKKVKVHFSATVEDYYCFIIKCDSIDIEMYPVLKNIPIEKTTSFRFDITGKKYDFYGVKIGMSLKEYLGRVVNKDVFNIKNILNHSRDVDYPYPFEYLKLLTAVKEENYYFNYDKAVYEQVVVNGVPYGAVMLFKGNILKRIVYGLPNAD